MTTATNTVETVTPNAALLGQNTEVAQDHQDDDVQMLSLAVIHKRENHNPRKIKSKKERAELKESIRTQNLLQPILVRPHPTILGDYELVAGETRYDLCGELGHITIPALIRHINDDDLTVAALSENVQRTDMIPSDEGRAAEIMLARYNDKDEVCRLLGWTHKKLDARIQLTHCIESVQQALADESIKLGHAEALSGLREKSQEDGLRMILNNKLSVDDFRQKIEALSLKLAVAPFDLSDCQTCPHNSSRQASLFDSKASVGQCMNKGCFDEKTKAHFDALKSDLAETYNKVGLSDQVPANTTTIVVASGTNGVGHEQVKACESCEHYGAIIDTRIGNKSHVTESVCFNLPCHGKMVKEYQNLIATDAQPVSGTEAAQAKPETKTPTGSSATEKAPASPKKPKAAPAKRATPAHIVKRHHQVHRNAAATAISSDAKVAMIMSILSLMSEARVKPKNVPQGWPDSLTGKNRAKAASLLDALDESQLSKLQQQIAATVIETASNQGGENENDCYGSVAVWYTASRECDLTKHFTVDQSYLTAFVKPSIADILEDSGFKAHFIEKNTEKAYTALINGKKEPMIKTVIESDFSFEGYLPGELKLTV
jgi:PRTRC genetic system ParB family protein